MMFPSVVGLKIVGSAINFINFLTSWCVYLYLVVHIVGAGDAAACPVKILLGKVDQICESLIRFRQIELGKSD